MNPTQDKRSPETQPSADEPVEPPEGGKEKTKEIGGPKGLEPTRYGDWERKGRCIDF